MGQYIQAGICYKAILSKTSMESNRVTYEYALKGLEKELALNLYNVKETEEEYIFSLKEEYLEKRQLSEFLVEQYKMFNDEEDMIKDIINKLNMLNTPKDIIDLAEEKRYRDFQQSSVYGKISIGWGKRVLVAYEMIAFFVVGKVIMECYDDFFTYIENLIKKDNPYTVSKAVKVLIG